MGFGPMVNCLQDLQKKFADVQRDAAVLHGDLEQDERMRVIDGFRKLRQSLASCDRSTCPARFWGLLWVLGGSQPSP